MNFEEKTFKLPIGKMNISEFDSTIKVQDGSIIGFLFLLFVFGITGYVFISNAEKLKQIDIHPALLIIGLLGLLFSLREIFIKSSFSTRIKLNEIDFITIEKHTAVHFITITMLVFYFHSGRKRGVWIYENTTKGILGYFSQRHINLK